MKASILIPHFRTWRWTASCIHAFKKFPFAAEHEIIVCDNSPGHPSIKCLTETDLGEGIKIVQGQADFPSHGKGYFAAYQQADGDWIFTAETDSFPTSAGWSQPYLDAAAQGKEFIAPIMPMAAGTYGHPAGALVFRDVLDMHEAWRKDQKDWMFIPDAARALSLSQQGYHAVVHNSFKESVLQSFTPDSDIVKNMNLWLPDVGPWQEMRSFDEDNFKTYGQRTCIAAWSPFVGKDSYLRIGYEPGQHLWYFAKSHGVECMEAPVRIEWIPGWEGRQAAFSTVFDGFTHVWCGTAAMGDATDPQIRNFKIQQQNAFFGELPDDLRNRINELEERNA